jgi:predicted lipoprotein
MITLRRLLILAGALLLSGCSLATVRTIEEDRLAKEGFSAPVYVNGIWESEFLPTLQENATDITTLLSEIDADEEAAIEQYGNRTSTGPYSFMARGEAVLLNVDRESRVGLGGLDLPPYDGEAEIFLAIGPVLRGNALRDAVGFIAFNDFTNQVEFAQVSDALKERADADVLQPFDIDNQVGETIRFVGAFTFSDRDEIVIMPVELEVVE